MPLSVDEIADMADKGSLKLRADHFADPVVSGIFDTHLACSELDFTVLKYTRTSMTAHGRCALRAFGKAPCRAVATFLRADPPDETVVGFTLLVDAPGWELPKPFPAFDLSPLRDLGAQSLVAAFNAIPGKKEKEGAEKEEGGEAEEAGEEQTSVPSRAPVLTGARWKLPELAEPVMFLAAVQKDERHLEGKLTIGSTEIEARTEESKDPRRWTLSARAESIAFSDISAFAEQTMGSGLPAWLTGLTLQELGFTVECTDSERSFAANAGADFPLTADFLTQVELDMKIVTKDDTSKDDKDDISKEDAPKERATEKSATKESKGKKRTTEVTVTGSFALGRTNEDEGEDEDEKETEKKETEKKDENDDEPLMRFELEADKDPESMGFTATSSFKDGMPLGEVLAALLPATASPTAGLPDRLPPVNKISLRYTAPKAPDVASLVLTAETSREDQVVLVVTGRNGKKR